MRCLTYGAMFGQARRSLLLGMKAGGCRLPWSCSSPRVVQSFHSSDDNRSEGLLFVGAFRLKTPQAKEVRLF